MTTAEAWRCDACEYVHPESEPPERCPACDVGPFGSWTGALNSCIVRLRVSQITDEMVERAARCSFEQDAEAHGNTVGWGMAPSDVRDDYREHVRAVLAAAFDEQTSRVPTTEGDAAMTTVRKEIRGFYQEVASYRDGSAVGHLSMEPIEVTDEMFERAWRAFDHRAAGGADTLLDEPWFEDAIRAALAAAFDEQETDRG